MCLIEYLLIKGLFQSLFKSIGTFPLTSKGLLIKPCLLSRIPLSPCHNLAVVIRRHSSWQSYGLATNVLVRGHFHLKTFDPFSNSSQVLIFSTWDIYLVRREKIHWCDLRERVVSTERSLVLTGSNFCWCLYNIDYWHRIQNVHTYFSIQTREMEEWQSFL